MYMCVIIDPEKNALLCNAMLVGINELVEIYERGDTTPPQATGKLLRKVADPDVFEVYVPAVDPTKEIKEVEEEPIVKRYHAGDRCIFKILYKTLSGSRRRKFFKAEKDIVDTEHGKIFHERKVAKAKTGSVRRRKRK